MDTFIERRLFSEVGWSHEVGGVEDRNVSFLPNFVSSLSS